MYKDCCEYNLSLFPQVMTTIMGGSSTYLMWLRSWWNWLRRHQCSEWSHVVCNVQCLRTMFSHLLSHGATMSHPHTHFRRICSQPIACNPGILCSRQTSCSLCGELISVRSRWLVLSRTRTCLCLPHPPSSDTTGWRRYTHTHSRVMVPATTGTGGTMGCWASVATRGKHSPRDGHTQSTTCSIYLDITIISTARLARMKWQCENRDTGRGRRTEEGQVITWKYCKTKRER